MPGAPARQAADVGGGAGAGEDPGGVATVMTNDERGLCGTSAHRGNEPCARGIAYSVPTDGDRRADRAARRRAAGRLTRRHRVGLLGALAGLPGGAAGLVLGGAEAGLRVRRQIVAAHLPLPPNDDSRFVADRLLRYKNRPSYSYQSRLRSGQLLTYTNNALGFRGPEISQPKPPGVYRVAIVGASTVYGSLNDDPDTISLQLEAMLREQLGPNIQVVNAGVPSYEALRELDVRRARTCSRSSRT